MLPADHLKPHCTPHGRSTCPVAERRLLMTGISHGLLIQAYSHSIAHSIAQELRNELSEAKSVLRM